MYAGTGSEDAKAQHKTERKETWSMSTNGDEVKQEKSSRSGTSILKSNSARSRPSWFHLPAPLRYVFDQFPLSVHDKNVLPQRHVNGDDKHSLFLFATDTQQPYLSFNPACLKWQAYLLIHQIPFEIRTANNHASPTGALPFLIPARKPGQPAPQPIPSSKIARWAESQGVEHNTMNLKLEAYMTLVDKSIRDAWLYYLYLTPPNFNKLARALYIETASSNFLVQETIAFQLRNAAREQLLTTRTIVDETEIRSAAKSAFEALDALLGSDQFFSKTDTPGPLDIALFSYTFPITALLGRSDVTEGTFSNLLMRYDNLISHKERLLHLCLRPNP